MPFVSGLRVFEMGCICGARGRENPHLSRLREILDKHRNDTGFLIPVLQEAQDAYGYLSEDVLEAISTEMSVPLSQIYGVTTFYSQFRLHPHGREIIKVCHGTACYVSGAEGITRGIAEELGIKVGETTEDRLFTLESVACLGACGLSPVMMIGDETYGRLNSQRARETVKKRRKVLGEEKKNA